MIVEDRKCKKHGLVSFIKRTDGFFRCRKCASESVIKRTKNKKLELVKYFGGRCIKCGYNKYVGALHFHHRNPKEKLFGIGAVYQKYSIARLIEEATKCDLVCANCHAEIENEV